MVLNNPEPPEELLRCFDDKENEIEPKTRQWLWDHPEEKFLHGIGSVWIINPKGEILCSLRSDKLRSNPGKWQTYFGGKVPVGSVPRETAIRELTEEIGIQADVSLLSLAKETPRVGRYIYPSDAETSSFVFPDGEITAVRWLSLEEIASESNEQPGKWCNLISQEYEQKISNWVYIR